MVIFSFFIWLASLIQIASLAFFAERISHKAKIFYFTKCIEKDADYYDRHNPTEMASRISKEVSAIQRATGENFGKLMMSFSSVFLGFGFAFFMGWKFTLILMASIPLLICVFLIFGISVRGGILEQYRSYAQSAGYAEQALHSIRIVHTYTNELLEHKNYVKYLERSNKAQFRFRIYIGMGTGLLLFNIFALYAAAFWFGGYFRFEEVYEGEGDNKSYYTGGKVIAIMFSVVFGAMNIGGAGPMFKIVNEGRIAGRLAFDVMDNVPKVNLLKGGKEVVSDKMQG